MYPLNCDAGPMNGDSNIIQLPKDKGLQGYVGRQILFKNLHKEKGYSRTRDEEDTKVRYDIMINDSALYNSKLLNNEYYWTCMHLKSLANNNQLCED
jgi:hypothetical protein